MKFSTHPASNNLLQMFYKILIAFPNIADLVLLKYNKIFIDYNHAEYNKEDWKNDEWFT